MRSASRSPGARRTTARDGRRPPSRTRTTCAGSPFATTAIRAREERSSSTRKGIGCVRCHSAGGRGTATIGPDLTGLASKYDRAELIRSVLEPSSRIATGYQPVIVATRDGKVLTGVVRAETDDRLELADAEAKITRIPKRDIEVRRAGPVSDHARHGRVALPGRVLRPGQLTWQV